MRFNLGSNRNFLLSIKINRAKFHGNMINQNKALKKHFPSLSKSPKFEQIPGKITRLRVPSGTPSGGLVWKPLDCVFSRVSIDYRTNTCEKQRKPLGFGRFAFTWELHHVNTGKDSMTSQDRHLEYQCDPKQWRLWPGFATLSWFHVFGRQHKRYICYFLDSKRQTERFKRMLRSLNINQRKTMEFDRSHALVTSISKCCKLLRVLFRWD